MQATTPPSPAQALIRFSVFTNSHGRLNKAFTRHPDGRITKESATQLWDGFVQSVAVPDLPALAHVLDSLSSDQAIALGVCDGSEDKPKRVLSEDRALARQSELQALGQLGLEDSPEFQVDADFVQRNKATFHYPTDALALYAIDVDDKWDADAPDPALLQDKYASLIQTTGLHRFAHVFRYSNSAGIEGLDSSGNFHLFFAAFPSEIPLIHDLIQRLLWSKSLGWISISKAGSLLVRQLIDASVNDPCRLWYEGPPVLTGLTLQPDFIRTWFQPGIPVLTYDALLPPTLPQSLPDLTDPAKAAAAPKAREIRRQVFAERRQSDTATLTQISIKAGRPVDPRALARALAKSYDHIDRYLYGSLPLYFKDSTVATVDQILLDEALARQSDLRSHWHDRTLRDPIEPDYQDFKITAKLWTDGAPQIHSQAHGGRTFRLLMSADAFLQHYLPLPTRDDRQAFIGMAAEFVAPDDEPHILSKLKSGDRTAWKHARSTFVDLHSPDASKEDIARYSNIKPIPQSLADAYWAEFSDTYHLGSQRYAQFPSDTRRWVFGNQRRPVINQIFDLFHRVLKVHPKWESWLGNPRNIEHVEKLICYGARQIKPELFDANPSILGLPGGYVLDFSDTAVIREATPNDMIRSYLPVFPTLGPFRDWETMIMTLCDYDLDAYNTILGMLAQAIANDPQKRILIIHGPANTGKSVFVELVAWMLGPYANTIGKDAVVINRAKGQDYDRVELALHSAISRRFVYTAEFSPGDTFNSVAIKTLTGGDTIRYRERYKDSMNGTFSGLLAAATNYLPSMENLDDSLRERLCILNTHRQYMLPNGETINSAQYAQGDPHIRQKLQAQAGSFLYRLIEEVKHYKRIGWQHIHPPEHMTCKVENLHYADSFLQFIATCTEKTRTRVGTFAGDIYESYLAWMALNYPGEKPLTGGVFGRRLTLHAGISVAKEGQTITVGEKEVTIGSDNRVWSNYGRNERVRLCVLK